jgi:lipoprotein NlpI
MRPDARPRNLRLSVLFVLAASGAFQAVSRALPEKLATLTQQTDILSKDDYSQALAKATEEIKADSKQAGSWLRRAKLYDSHREHAKAASDYSEVIKLDPKNPNPWQLRGEANFRAGKIVESIQDFDKVLNLVPDRKPYHWQRGISLYYAGRFGEGKQQFELHQTVNSNDVENAVWHFLCTARAEGLDAAKKSLISIQSDARIPMAQVHQLFAGKASPDDVLRAARAGPAQTRAAEPMFYANLYLGLYFEAIGDGKKARDYILQAAERSKENGYMGDVARIHAGVLRKSGSKLKG